MPSSLRIFLSSPGDVPEERVRAGLIIQKLARDYAPHLAITSYLWEYEPMLASGHFQDAIEPPSAADIVVLVLWSRLGTALPPRTELREYKGLDGRVPVTGTEWEFEDALAANRARGAPDLLAYRRLGDPGASLTNPALRAEQERQWNALEGFWSKYFENQGLFLAGSAKYTRLEEFDRKVEADLTRLIERRIQAQHRAEEDGPTPVWLKSSPFRGLSVYNVSDAPVFFGRDGETRTALTRLQEAAAHGTAFLLVLGASGSGKSSLARAGLVAALMAAKAIPGVGLWRHVAMRPGDAGSDPVLALAQALLTGDPSQNEGLPELAGPGVSAADLARHLRTSAEDASFPFRTALNALAQTERAKRALLAHEEARLVLLVDQVEELFTRPDISAPDRLLFARLLSGLAHSGLVWVITTLRSDLWHRAAEIPELLALSEAGTRFDLLPPNGAALLEMIRQPAKAAGLNFDADPQSGLRLDAVLAQAAAEEPGALPLLSVMLDTLYQRDVLDKGSRRLTFASYRALGELTGAIAQRAEDTLASLVNTDPEAAATLPDVLRALVTTTMGSAVTAQSAPLVHFAGHPVQMRLLERFLASEVRLLTAEDRGHGAEIRLAHEALIEHWPRAKEQITRDRRDLETRARLESLLRRYQEANSKDKSKALLSRLPLEEGVDLVKRWHIESNTALGRFVAVSARAAQVRARVFMASAAGLVLVFAGIAALAVFQTQKANEQTRIAKSAQAQEQTARLNAEKQKEQAVRSESVALGSQSSLLITGLGKPDLAFQLASQGLPKLWSRRDRPATDAALQAFFQAYEKYSSQKIAVEQRSPHGGSSLTAIRVSQDGRYVATSAWDATARILNSASFDELASLHWYAGPGNDWFCKIVTSVDISPGNNLAATSNLDGKVRLWSLQNGKSANTKNSQPLQTLSAATDDAQCTPETWGDPRPTILSVSFNQSGELLVSAAADGSTSVWNTTTGERIDSYKHPIRVNAAVFNKKVPNEIIFIDDAGAASFYNFISKEITRALTFGGALTSLTLSSSGEHALITVSDGTSRLIHLASGREDRRLIGHSDWVKAAAFGPADSWVATGSDDGTVRLWDTETGATFATISIEQQITGVAVDQASGAVIVSTLNGKIHIWKDSSGLRTGEVGQAVSIARARFDKSPWKGYDAFNRPERLGISSVNTGQLGNEMDSLCALIDHPDDPERRGAGMETYRINPKQGQEVCEEAVSKAPHAHRYYSNLGRILSARGNFALAENYYRRAIEKGSWIAAVALVELQQTNFSGRAPENVDLLELASMHGVSLASWYLAGMLWKGEGVLADSARSREMVLKAAKGGVPAAHVWLAKNMEAHATGWIPQTMFHYAVAAELYEERGDYFNSRSQHENRSRIARDLPNDIVANWFSRALSWRRGEDLPAESLTFAMSGNNMLYGPNESKVAQTYEQPQISSHKLDGCLKSSLSWLPQENRKNFECSPSARKEIASHFCRMHGYTKGDGEARDGGAEKAVKLVIEPGQGVELNYFWAPQDRGGYLFTKITCQ
jgi:WD40 repeat protein